MKPEEAVPWGERLKAAWERRARSPFRDFFVDSRPDWEDPAVWDRFARASAELVLQAIPPDRLAAMEVLEIGCGVGRLVPYVAPRVRGYTGFDIAPAMVAEARRRFAGRADCRFLEGDGLTVPAAAADRRYGLAFALAVFIHCPRPVIAALARSACGLLEPGGQLRFQLLAEPADPEGLPAEIPPAAGAPAAPPWHPPAEVRELAEGCYYMGDRFRLAEAGPFLEAATGCRAEVFRPEPAALYGFLVKE